MRNDPVVDLGHCTEFRQALQARPPAIVHGTATLLALALGAALAWSAATKASLVVRAPGRVRPETTPVRVASAAGADSLGVGVAARVASVHFSAGDEVRRGQVLIRLESDRLDNEIARLREAIGTFGRELGRLDRLVELERAQDDAALAKAEAELLQARGELDQARRRREAEIRRARAALEAAEQQRESTRQLVLRRAAPPADLIRSNAEYLEARATLEAAEVPPDERKPEVARWALELARRAFEPAQEERELRRSSKRSELEAARSGLANLELIRRQAVILAPVSGVVTAGDVKVGDLLEPGKAVVEIAREGDLRFEAVVPSEGVGDLRVGMAARIRLDAFDYQRYGTLEGVVTYIAPDSAVPDPAGDRASGAAVVYVVKIRPFRAELGRGPRRGRARLGMAGVAELVTDRESLLSLLVRQIRRTISLG